MRLAFARRTQAEDIMGSQTQTERPCLKEHKYIDFYNMRQANSFQVTQSLSAKLPGVAKPA
jgi:hypothetical protein